MSAEDVGASLIYARLREAAETREALELILVLRGQIRAVRGRGGWSVRVVGGGRFKFPADAVLALTPLPHDRRRVRRLVR